MAGRKKKKPPPPAVPKPGSDEAVERGCRCPCLDNAHGRGAWGDPDLFWVQADCPLHGEGSSWQKKE